jgi:fumarate hydratase subunit beta
MIPFFMNNKTVSLTIPIPDVEITRLHVGDSVLLNGFIVTGRDAAHKWLYDHFIVRKSEPSSEDQRVYQKLKPLLNGGVIYHCGPVVSGLETGNYRFVSAGPTTSAREEPYQADIMRHFNLKGVLGKGGMGKNTMGACAAVPSVYFHAIGGAAVLMAQSVVEVLDVFKLEFGVPEALWVIRVKDFPAIVTMDAHGSSLHEKVRAESEMRLKRLITN